MKGYEWYTQLIKPRFAPPSWIFGPVWTVLYVLIVVSFGQVFVRAYKGDIPVVVTLPFILNLVFNFLFTPLQFGLKNNYLAAIDIILVLGTLIWALVSIWPYMRHIVYINIPYLAWVSFATVLQLSVMWLNR